MQVGKVGAVPMETPQLGGIYVVDDDGGFGSHDSLKSPSGVLDLRSGITQIHMLYR